VAEAAMVFKCTIILLLLSSITLAQPAVNTIKTGDIVFQDMDCGDLCNAIEKVTQSYGNNSFSHMGLCYWRTDTLYVIEAVGKGVILTPYQAFINRSADSAGKPKIKLARVKYKHAELVQGAVNIALSYLGTPYDDYYIMGDDKMYCSELMYRAFYKANNNHDFFELEPMTFKDPDTHTYFPAWVTYYTNLDIPIPEGFMGCNPGGISRSKHLEFVE
jgi:uncharacterized protein YycO